MTIRMSMKGLAKYVTAQPAAQRKILRDYKFPDPEGRAQASYYRDAMLVIRRVVSSKITGQRARAIAADWRPSAVSLPLLQRIRRQNNARAVEQYVEHYAQHAFEPLPNPAIHLVRGSVVISATPDLRVREGRREILLKLEFGKERPDDKLLRVMSQVMFEATSGNATSNVAIFDVPRGRAIRGARMGSRLRADIDAACRNIEAIWPTIAPPPDHRKLRTPVDDDRTITADPQEPR